MSQNKTIVPGVDYGNNENQDYGYPDDFGGLYTRSTNLDTKRTCIAGSPEVPVEDNVSIQPPVIGTQQAIAEKKEPRQIALQNRIVVGVLFSISRGLLGELFPLYLGRNVMGRSDICDVCLQEMTVSPEHAILYIRKDENQPGQMVITITDYNSMYGTTVNGIDGRYETLNVKENDIIAIGKHYKFVVKTFNAERLGLSEETEFEESNISNDTGQNDSNVGAEFLGSFYSPTSSGTNSSRTVIG